MKTKDGFRLSRVQAEGWTAARARASSQSDDSGNLDAAAIEALCPYPSDPQKSRWVAGFRSASNVRQANAAKETGGNEAARPRKTLHLCPV